MLHVIYLKIIKDDIFKETGIVNHYLTKSLNHLTLLHLMKGRRVKRSLATLCLGGGNAVSVVLEIPEPLRSYMGGEEEIQPAYLRK